MTNGKRSVVRRCKDYTIQLYTLRVCSLREYTCEAGPPEGYIMDHLEHTIKRIGSGSHQPNVILSFGGDITTTSNPKRRCCGPMIVMGGIRFPLSVFIMIMTLLSIMTISSFVVYDMHNNTTLHIECIQKYEYISFGYIKWLSIYAWTNAGILGVLLWLFGISKVSGINLDTVKLFILRIGYSFQFAWYIVGAVLYFTEVYNVCEDAGGIADTILHYFGLCLFVSQSTVWIIIIASLLPILTRS
jgi:hypothetical protein